MTNSPEVKYLLTKMAELDTWGAPKEVGSRVGNLIMNMPSAAGADLDKFTKDNNLTPQEVTRIQGYRTRAGELARDPATWTGYNVTGFPKAVQDLMAESGADFSKNLSNGQRLGMLFGNTKGFEGRKPLDSNWGIPGQTWDQGLAAYQQGIIGLTGEEDPAAKARFAADYQQKMMPGLVGAYNRDSPFMRDLIGQAGTGYALNQIDHYAPRGTWYGDLANPIGKFMLGMASTIPGYNNAVGGIVDYATDNAASNSNVQKAYQQYANPAPAPAPTAPAPTAPAPTAPAPTPTTTPPIPLK